MHRWLTSGVPDWHLLPCVVLLTEVIGALPGHLSWNREETRPISNTPWVYTPFVNRYVSPGVPDWSEGKTLCKQCVLGLMGRHILRSLRELKTQRRSSRRSPRDVSGSNQTFRPDGPQLEDCWYGYNCRTQRKHDHAVKLNVGALVLVSVMPF